MTRLQDDTSANLSELWAILDSLAARGRHMRLARHSNEIKIDSLQVEGEPHKSTSEKGSTWANTSR